MSIAAGVVLALLAIMLSPHPVSAQQAPTASISASPTSITLGGSSTLSWSSTNATSCTGDGFSTGGATSGSVSVSPSSVGMYQLYCTGPNGGANSPVVTVTVPRVDFTVDYVLQPQPIAHWSSAWVSSCTGTNFSTGGATQGTAYLSPSQTTTYGITCAASDSTVSGDPVTIRTGTITLTANPSTIAYGELSTLTLSSTNARQCMMIQPYDPYVPVDWPLNTSAWLGPGGPTSASIAVGPPHTATYSVWCDVFPFMRNVTVTVTPPPSLPTVAISASPASIQPGGSSTLTWSSTDATSCTGDGFSTGGATSGSVSVSPGSSTSYRVTCTGSGGSASLEALVQVIMPSCTVTLDSTTVPYGTGTYLRWSSSNATSFYIANVGYVTPVSSGAVLITPSGTTSYPATCSGSGGSASATGVQTLTVTPPSVPTATITADSTSIVVGSSTTIRASFGVPSNDTLTASNIDQPLGTGRGASTAPGSKTYVFTPTSAGTYVFYARATTQYFSAWTTYGSVTVTVTDPPNNCELGGITVSHGTSHTFYTQQVATDGSSCSSYSQARTCTDGALSGSDAYRFASCTCAASYSCSGSNVTYTNASCETSTVDSCAAPAYCVAGQSSCQFGGIEFVEFDELAGGLTGHLQAQPAIIRSGDTTRLYWQVTGAESCAVSGGGQNWTGLSSGSSGVQTNALTQLTRYTLHCVAHSGQDDVTETLDVLVTPRFQET